MNGSEIGYTVCVLEDWSLESIIKKWYTCNNYRKTIYVLEEFKNLEYILPDWIDKIEHCIIVEDAVCKPTNVNIIEDVL